MKAEQASIKINSVGLLTLNTAEILGPEKLAGAPAPWWLAGPENEVGARPCVASDGTIAWCSPDTPAGLRYAIGITDPVTPEGVTLEEDDKFNMNGCAYVMVTEDMAILASCPPNGSPLLCHTTYDNIEIMLNEMLDRTGMVIEDAERTEEIAAGDQTVLPEQAEVPEASEAYEI